MIRRFLVNNTVQERYLADEWEVILQTYPTGDSEVYVRGPFIPNEPFSIYIKAPGFFESIFKSHKNKIFEAIADAEDFIKEIKENL